MRKKQVKPKQEMGKDNNFLGRRSFLRSLLGIGSLRGSSVFASSQGSAVFFLWVDLKTGHVGFPTGTSVPLGLPGSLMKLVAAAALREEEILPADAELECKGSYNIKQKTFSCLYPHGRLKLIQAIGLSCNVFFAQAAKKLSTAVFLDYAQKLGFTVPQEAYAAAESQTYVLGLAESLRTTALEILQMSSLIATAGQILKLEGLPASEALAQTKQPLRQANFAASTWVILQQGMRLASRQGTAKQLDLNDTLHLAVKTGTAPYGKTFQSWITGYFPYEGPAYAFCLRAPVGTSQEKAVPLARTFLFSSPWP